MTFPFASVARTWDVMFRRTRPPRDEVAVEVTAVTDMFPPVIATEFEFCVAIVPRFKFENMVEVGIQVVPPTAEMVETTPPPEQVEAPP